VNTVKRTNFKEEIAQLSLADLRERLNNLRYSLFGLKINVSTAHVKDYSQFKKMRKDIARLLTLIAHKESMSV
jgi:ribosomal protein L29